MDRCRESRSRKDRITRERARKSDARRKVEGVERPLRTLWEKKKSSWLEKLAVLMVEAAISATENRRATVFISENFREWNRDIWIQQVKLSILNCIGVVHTNLHASYGGANLQRITEK